MSWRKPNWKDDKSHYFSDQDGTLRRAACGIYYNIKHTLKSDSHKCNKCNKAAPPTH